MDNTLKIIEIISGSLTSLAIIVGGFWTYFLFVQNRQKYPRAIVKHEVIQKYLGKGKTLLHVIITVENLGDVLIELALGEVRVLQVLPIIGEIEESIPIVKTSTGQRRPIGEFITKDLASPEQMRKTELPWYQLFSIELPTKEQACEIEPKETESFHCDFVINKEVQTVEIYSYFHNKKKRGKQLGWTCTTMHDIIKKEIR